MEKTMLTKAQADALESALAKGKKQHIIEHKVNGLFTDDEEALNQISLERLIVAMFIGYNLEPTPEEKVKSFYQSLSEETEYNPYRAGVKFGVLETLKALKIKIAGVNCNG